MKKQRDMLISSVLYCRVVIRTCVGGAHGCFVFRQLNTIIVKNLVTKFKCVFHYFVHDVLSHIYVYVCICTSHEVYLFVFINLECNVLK